MIHDPCLLEGADAACCQSQINGAAAFCGGCTGVRAPIVEVDPESATRKKYREKGARKAGSDDVDRVALQACAR